MYKFDRGMKSVARKSMAMILKYSLSLLLFLNITIALGQDLTQHNWYFGSTNNGIRFNRGNNKAQAITLPAPFIPLGTGGSAVATDPATGNLLFYSDGVNVYDACYNKMKDPTGNPHFPLSGNSAANQPVVFCPVPRQAQKYYVFTNDVAGIIRWVIVDLTLSGGSIFPAPATGEISSNSETAILGLTGRSEGMMVIPHANGNDYWLVTHENGQANYNAILIDNNFALGLITNVTTLGVGLSVSVSNFSYNHKLKKLAVAVQSPKDDALIVDFNPATGAVSFDRFIYNTGVLSATTSSIYDIQWDVKGGQYLYISRTSDAGVPADVLQYDYTGSLPGVPSTIISSIYSAPTIAQSFGLHLAPDSAIYHIYQAIPAGPFLVEKLTKIDTIAQEVIKTPLPFGSIDFNGKQFPSFSPPAEVNLMVSFTSTASAVGGNCQNNPITFFPDVKPNADSLSWDFGDGGMKSKAWSPVHKFAQAQTFMVSLTAFYQGKKKTVTNSITITAFTLQLQLVQDTTSCKCQLPVNQKPKDCTLPNFSVTAKTTGGNGTPQFSWSDQKTKNATFFPDSAGYYYVVATDGTTGCSVYGGVNVKEYGKQDQRSNIWYFGNKAGIDFNPRTPPGPPIALATSAMNAPEGCAIVCDRNGQAIFYTDGRNVYDKTNTSIANDLMGDTDATQSSLIVPVPGDETLYYIFTTQKIESGTNELRYSIFDLKQNGGNGAITQKNVLLFSKSTERITANGQWIIAHEYGNSTFRSYRITNQGISEAVYSDIGSIHSSKSTKGGEGYMKLGARDNLAVALSTDSGNILELFQLNDTTGNIRNYRSITEPASTGQIYGVEFSSGGRKLFATFRESPSSSSIIEYSLDTLDIKNPVLVKKTSKSLDMGAIQIAPDGQIYIAINDAANNKSLGTINADENKIITASSINFNGFTLAGGTNSRLGLPNFIQQQGNGFGGPDFTFANTCSGETTEFVGTPTDPIDDFTWDFGDGTGLPAGKVSSPTHKYPLNLTNAPIIYKATMLLTNRCNVTIPIVRKDVTIFPAAPKPTIPPSVALCTPPVTLNANTAGLPGLSFAWSNGAPDAPTVDIFNPTRISVTITTLLGGCKSSASSIIASPIPQVELGEPEKICQNSTFTIDSKITPGAATGLTISWNGIPTNSPTQVVNTSIPGTFTYTISVQNSAFPGCSETDTKIVTVSPSPGIDFKSSDAPTCGGDGGLSLTLLNSAPIPGGPNYSYAIFGGILNPSPPNPPGSGIDVTVTGVPIVFTAKAGTYSALVIDQISGCQSFDTKGISEPTSFTISAAPALCDLTRVTIGGGFTPSLQYKITSQASTTPLFVKTSNSNIEDFNLPVGGYVIEVQDNNLTGCLSTFNYTVPPTILPTVTINPTLCGNPSLTAALSSGTATSYNWTFPNNTTLSTTSNPTLNLSGNANAASGFYKVDVTLSTTCIVTGSVSIILPPTIVPDFAISDECSPTARLVASPVGNNFTYQWFLGSTLQPSLAGSEVFVQTSGSYSVTVVDVNGCPHPSPNKTVTVFGEVSVSFDSFTAPCNDGTKFTLSVKAIPTDVTYQWFFNNSTTPIANETAATIQASDGGSYKVKVTKVGSTCSDDATVSVNKKPRPISKLPVRVVICADPENQDPNTKEIKLDPGLNDSYKWFYKADKSTTSRTPLPDITQVIPADKAGIFIVDITTLGCTATGQTEVLNECIPIVSGPNAFRPANALNPTNKDFFVYSFFIKDENFEVAIFNRWGEIVYESKDRYFKWNGGYGGNSGQPLPGGTYAYVIRYQSSFRPEEGVKEKRGGVVLLR
jgi:large repetitive protein